MMTMIFCLEEIHDDETESILLAICFGYVLGDTLSKLVLVVSDVVRSIKRRKQTKTGK